LYLLAVSFLSCRSMTSWKPNTIISGLEPLRAGEIKKNCRNVTLFVLVRTSGLAASMFQVQMRILSGLKVQKDASRVSISKSKRVESVKVPKAKEIEPTNPVLRKETHPKSERSCHDRRCRQPAFEPGNEKTGQRTK
jgi:hypothetical protein